MTVKILLAQEQKLYTDLGVYLFGIVSAHEKNTLSCHYFTEGEGAKGGNNVALMLHNNFKHCNSIEKKEGGLGEYVIVMDNCGGQNKN